MKNRAKGITSILLYVCIYFLFSLIVFQNLRTNYLGGDEPFTFAMIHHNFPTIIGLTAKDVHPFLYYFLARLCIIPFKNIFTQIKALKLLSALPYLIMLIVANTSIKHEFSIKTSLIFMFTLITVPVLNTNMLISRMYGWTMLFTTLIFLLLIYVYKGILNNSLSAFIGISLLTLADGYTQYDAILSIAVISAFFLILFIHSNISIKNFLISIVISILLYLPWLKVMFKQTKYVSGSSYYAPKFIFKIGIIVRYTKNLVMELFDITPYNIIPSKKFQLIILAFLLLILVNLYLVHTNNKSILLFGLVLPFIIMLFGLLICMKENHQILYPRYLISALGIFWLCVANIVSEMLNYKRNHIILGAILIIFILMIGLKSYHSSYNQLKPYINSLDQSEALMKSIPHYSHVIVNTPVMIEQMSIYLPTNENYIMGNNCTVNNEPMKIWSNKKRATQGSIYTKVFKNMHIKEDLQLPTYKHSYFVRFIGNSQTKSSLGKSFYDKNKSKLIKLKSVQAPISLFGHAILYKIR